MRQANKITNLQLMCTSHDKQLAYGAGMTDCEKCGIEGLCGHKCPAYETEGCFLAQEEQSLPAREGESKEEK